MLHRHHIVPIIQVSLRWRQHFSTGVTLSRLHTESVISGQLSEAGLLCVLWFLKNHIPSLWFRVTEFLRNPASTCHAVFSFIGINNQNKSLVIQEMKKTQFLLKLINVIFKIQFLAHNKYNHFPLENLSVNDVYKYICYFENNKKHINTLNWQYV